MLKHQSQLLYLASVGVLSYMVATVVHEVIGHCGVGLLVGNKIELLTTVYFKSTPGNILVDLGGPIANLIFGLLGLYFLRTTSFAKLFLFQVIAYNLFWFSGTVLHSAISKTGDWAYAVSEIINEPYRKFLLVIVGFLCYTFILRILNYYLGSKIKAHKVESLTKKNIAYSFLFAAISAFVAGLFFQPNRLGAALEGLLEMAASLPILFLNFTNNPFAENKKSKQGHYFEAIVLLLYLVFCLVLGRGIT